MSRGPTGDQTANWPSSITLMAATRSNIRIGHVLYQSDGWISHLRLSPHGDKIAFINHPYVVGRSGVDLRDRIHAGACQDLSPEWDSADGLAWSSDGKEIWFTAAESGYTAELAGGKCRGEDPNHSNHPGGHDLAGHGS